MVKLIDCPTGLFIYDNMLCLKTAYFNNGRVEAYVVSSGELFSPAPTSPYMLELPEEEYNNLMVHPVISER